MNGDDLIQDYLRTFPSERALVLLIEEGKRKSQVEQVQQDTDRLNKLIAFRDEVSTTIGGLTRDACGERRLIDREAHVGR
ncbi:MAG: hypothetical protein K8U57_36065 [Planctomycetes bacterium]|nr:hypothetical protein [Planctomycetota bacterium]